jgi:hypothetical protein
MARPSRRGVAADLDPRPLVTTVDDDGSLAALLGDNTISAQDRVAIAFASPAFQWR